jgi:hypothetical protein
LPHTLGKTRSQETRNLLDQSLRSNEGIVLASKLLDELLVLVELTEVLSGHAVDAMVLSTVKVVLVTKNTISIRQLLNPPLVGLLSSCDISHLIEASRSNAPDAHVGTRDRGQLDGAGETLVTLGVIVLQADLELDGLEEVTLLGVLRVVQKLLDILTHSGCC